MKTVTVYTTSWCGYCKSEMKWLDSKKIPYEAINVEEDKEALSKLEKELGFQIQGVPLTKIGKEFIRGFDKPAIQKALGI